MNFDRYEIDAATGCWNWTGSVSPAGYGKAYDGRRVTNAHRLLWERAHGPIPTGLDLDHVCRNRLCVNPSHMEPVSRAINTQRGRAARLNERAAAHARRMYAAGGVTQKQIADHFGVGVTTINSVVRGMSWRDVAEGG